MHKSTPARIAGFGSSHRVRTTVMDRSVPIPGTSWPAQSPPSAGQVSTLRSVPRGKTTPSTRLAANHSAIIGCAGATHRFMTCLLWDGPNTAYGAAWRDDPASHRGTTIHRRRASAHHRRWHGRDRTTFFVGDKPSMSVSSTLWRSYSDNDTTQSGGISRGAEDPVDSF